MGKRTAFLSRTLKTIPYPKKGSDRQHLLKDAENKVSQLEAELAHVKHQQRLDGKLLAEAQADRAAWQKKYEQLHDMVGRHVCEQQRPQLPPSPANRDPQQPPGSQGGAKGISTAIVLSATAVPAADPPHPRREQPPAIQATPAPTPLATASASVSRPPQRLSLPSTTATSTTTTTITTTTTALQKPSPPPSHSFTTTVTWISPRVLVIPVLFILSALTRFLQRGPVYPSYLDAAINNTRGGNGVGGRPVFAPGSIVQLLCLNIIVVTLLGEVARWYWTAAPSQRRWKQTKKQKKPKGVRFLLEKGAASCHDDGEHHEEVVEEEYDYDDDADFAPAHCAFLVAVCDEAWSILLMAILAFALLLFEVRDFAFI
ncbi:hypothetical protein DBV05_g3416 [Lasiodiplodia theobromae]|uniref:Uncharacterized protein n=1 Tax=Lasiodiplodia theobromae TaxID=45133 RepID=A0A5N5DKC6_9PEZI|nr:hypothetical protein DBV05_g3416 [Lasiodiplodia theobromae]